MEHRNGLRLPLNLEVELWRSGRKCGCYRTGNLSSGGLFIENCHQLRVGDFVLAKLKTTQLSNPRANVTVMPVKALTVHVSGRGAGLMWADWSESFHRVLDNLTKAAA